MAKACRLVVFDWEGTLSADSIGHALTLLSQALERLQLGPLDVSFARQLLRLGLAPAVKKLCPNLPFYQQEKLLHDLHKELTLGASVTRLMPGAFATVRWLHEAAIHLAIATNKGQQGLDHALRDSGLDAFFQVTRSASHSPPKPCPQMLEEIIVSFAVSASQTMMVGDSVNDMIMAQTLGVTAIGLDFFNTEASTLRAAGASHVFADYQQLLDYLKAQLC